MKDLKHIILKTRSKFVHLTLKENSNDLGTPREEKERITKDHLEVYGRERKEQSRLKILDQCRKSSSRQMNGSALQRPYVTLSHKQIGEGDM